MALSRDYAPKMDTLLYYNQVNKVPATVAGLSPAKFDTHGFSKRGCPAATLGAVRSSPPRALGRRNKEIHIDQSELVPNLLLAAMP